MSNPSTVGLAKFLSYILGRHPDEFGLVTDLKGFVKIRDLLKALSEEDGWRHVRRASLNEIILTLRDAPIEIADERTRAVNREHLPESSPAKTLPKLLYTCVRQKAHPVVVEQGVTPIGGLPDVVMAADESLAMRMGKRYDANPLLLTVQTDWALSGGVAFRQFGEHLFLSDYIPPGAFIAPPLPKEKENNAKKEKQKPPPPKVPQHPGSFFPEIIDPDEKKKAIAAKKKREKARDKEKRKRQKQKQKW